MKKKCEFNESCEAMQVQLIKTVNSIFESMAANCMIIKSFDLQFTEFRELFKLKSVLILFKLKINNAFKMKFWDVVNIKPI